MSFVDERIVKMVFDNRDFSSKISSTIGDINQLNKATDNVANNSNGGLSLMGKAFEKTEMMATQAGFHIQDVWLKMSNVFEYQIARKIVDTAKNIANALTMEGVTDGFKEYELKMGSIQTIMAGTGESLATVNSYLEELNKYSDQTIYSFADMTNNIGKFTNAGVKLQDAVAAIKGIANEAAISGANAQEASRAMYNFSQALSSGYVKLIDWKSIENANMATKSFKETLLEVATTVGTVSKAENGMFKILTTNAQGKVMDELVSGTKNFNDSLQQQWMTTDVLTKTLKIYATDVLGKDVTEAEKKAYEAELRTMGMTEEQIKKFEEMGHKATLAASEIKTFSMLKDTLKEAVGSGWAMTWQTIIGDFEQAKSLWTSVGNVVGGAIDKMSDVRNTFLKKGLETGWEKFTTISGASIPQTTKFKEILLEVGVAGNKISKANADAIETTEDLVKSFHELKWVTGNTLVDAVDEYFKYIKRLTLEERKELGITDANVIELTNLNEQLKDGGLSADFFARKMNELGGRENLIEGIKNSFQALLKVLTPIKEGFREIFPAATSTQLFNLTKRFKDFSEGLGASDETINNIKRTARGFFAAFKIAGRFISAFVKAIFPLSGGLKKLGGDFLSVTAAIGDYISGLNDSIAENKTFEKAFSGISNAMHKVTDSIKNFSIGEFKEKVKDVIGSLSKLSPGNNKVLSSIINFFKKLGKELAGGLENVKERLAFFKPLIEGLVSLFKGLVSIVGYVFKTIGDTISGVSSGNNGLLGLTGLFNALFGGGILYKLFSGVKTFSKVGDLLESVGGAFESFSKKIQAENLLNIAKAVAILAASLFVVAMIDEDKLLGATTAISAMITVMTGAMAGLMKAISVFSVKDVSKTFSLFGKTIFGTDAKKLLEMSVTLKAVSRALVAMGAAVLLMSIGLKVVSSAAEGGHLWDSFAVITLMLAELMAAVIALGKFGKGGDKGAKNLKTISLALILMSAALAIVAKVAEGGHAWDALKIISLMLAELGIIVVLIEKFGNFKLGGMGGLISLAISLNIVVLAVKKVSDALGEEGQQMWQALVFCGVLLAGLAGLAVLLAKFGGSGLAALVGGGGALLAAAALLIIVQAIKQMSDLLSKTNNQAWPVLGYIASVLAILAVTLTAMVAALPGAAALVVASAALIILAGALKLLGMLKWGEIVKGLVSIGVTLLLLAAGLTAMIAALPGAAALLVASVALAAIAGVLKILGNMKVKQIIKSLVTLIATLATIAAIGTILSTVSPLLLLFGAAVAALGVGLIAVGAGLTVFSAGLQALVAVLPLGAEALKQLGELLGEFILIALNKVFQAIGLIAKKIVEYTPQIVAAVVALIKALLQIIVQTMPDIVDTAMKVITAILQGIANNLPDFIKAGTDIIVALIEGIGESLPRIIDAAFKAIITFIDGLATAIEENTIPLINVVGKFMKVAAEALSEWVKAFFKKGAELIQGIADGMASLGSIIWEWIKAKLLEAWDGLVHFIPNLIKGAKALVDGTATKSITDALEKEKDKIKEAARELYPDLSDEELGKKLAEDTLKNLNLNLGIHSPSTEGEKSGKYLALGLANGMVEGEKYVIASATKLTDSVKKALDQVSDISEENMEIHPVISPVLDLSNVDEIGSAIGNLSPSASLEMASSINSLHDSRIRQEENNNRKMDELNFSSQKIEKSINEMSNNVVKAITESDVPVNVNLTLQGDSAQIFKLVRQENSKFTKMNGYNALAY